MKMKLLAFALILVLALAGAFAFMRVRNQTSGTLESNGEVVVQPVEDTEAEQIQASYMYVATESGQLALDLLRMQAEVETQDYGDAGEFVTSINGLAGNNQYYWAFYLNNEYAERGASQTTLQEGDVIRFVYEAVQLTPPTDETVNDEVLIDPASGTVLEGAEDATSAGAAE